MKIGVQIKGGARLGQALDRLDPAARKMFVVGLKQAAVMMHGEARRSIQEHRSAGKTYTHYMKMNRSTGQLFPWKERNKPHTASRPGNPPNTDSGALVRAIGWTIDENALTAAVGLNPATAKPNEMGGNPMVYGPALEEGTSRVKKRPWLRPAYKKVLPFVRSLFKLSV